MSQQMNSNGAGNSTQAPNGSNSQFGADMFYFNPIEIQQNEQNNKHMRKQSKDYQRQLRKQEEILSKKSYNQQMQTMKQAGKTQARKVAFNRQTGSQEISPEKMNQTDKNMNIQDFQTQKQSQNSSLDKIEDISLGRLAASTGMHHRDKEQFDQNTYTFDNTQSVAALRTSQNISRKGDKLRQSIKSQRRSQHSKNSSQANISVINYNNATINMNFEGQFSSNFGQNQNVIDTNMALEMVNSSSSTQQAAKLFNPDNINDKEIGSEFRNQLNYSKFMPEQEQQESVTLNLQNGTWMGSQKQGQGRFMQNISQPSSHLQENQQFGYVSSHFGQGSSQQAGNNLFQEKGTHLKIKSLGTVEYNDSKTKHTRDLTISQNYGSSNIKHPSSQFGADSTLYTGKSTPSNNKLMTNGAIIAGNFGLNARNNSTINSNNGYISMDPVTTYRVDYSRMQNNFKNYKNESQITTPLDYGYQTDINSAKLTAEQTQGHSLMQMNTQFLQQQQELLQKIQTQSSGGVTPDSHKSFNQQALNQILQQQKQLIQLNQQLFKQLSQQTEKTRQSKSQSVRLLPTDNSYTSIKQEDSKFFQNQQSNHEDIKRRRQEFMAKKKRKTTIKRILKKTKTVEQLAMDTGMQNELLKQGITVDDYGDFKKKRGSMQTIYEVQTIKVDQRGDRSISKRLSIDKEPKEVSDVLNSLHMLKMIKQNSQKQIRKYSKSQLDLAKDPYKENESQKNWSNTLDGEDSSEYTKQFDNMQAGYLSKIMHPKNVASVLTLNTGPSDDGQKVYVQTVGGLVATNNRKSRKKITIIQKKRRSDGSIESRKQTIYKDYGDQYAKDQSNRSGSQLQCFAGSARALQKVVRSGNSITILPNGKFAIQTQRDLSAKANIKSNAMIQGTTSTPALHTKIIGLNETNNNIQKQLRSTGSFDTLIKKDNGVLTVPNSANQQQQSKGVKVSNKKNLSGSSNANQQKQDNPYDEPKVIVNLGLQNHQFHRNSRNDKKRQALGTGQMKKADEVNVYAQQNTVKEYNNMMKVGSNMQQDESSSLTQRGGKMQEPFDLQPRANPSNYFTSNGQDSNAADKIQALAQRRDAVIRPREGKGIDLVAGGNSEFDKSSTKNIVNMFAQPQNDNAYEQSSPELDKVMNKKPSPNLSEEQVKEMLEKNKKQNTLEKQATQKSRLKKKNTGKSQATNKLKEEQKVDEVVGDKRNNIPQTNNRHLEVQPNQIPQVKWDHPSENTSSALSSNLHTFKLPAIDPTIYIQFLDQLLFGNNRKKAIMQPIPPAVGQLKFSISRNKGTMNKLTPSFYLNLEKSNGGTVLILYAKKMPFKKSSYYLISLQKNKQRVSVVQKETDLCIGKLRAIDGDQDKFILYDNGENYQQKGVQYRNLRKEHGTFIYRYEPCNVGNIRKMIILYPALTCMRIAPRTPRENQSIQMTNDPSQAPLKKQSTKRRQKSKDSTDNDPMGQEKLDSGSTSSMEEKYSVVPPSQYQKGLGVKGVRDKAGREIPDSKKYLYSYVDWRPTNQQETLLYAHENGQIGRETRYKVFVDNPPQWNAKTNTYVYDFKGRVTEPSIKNFQLIPEIDGKRGETLNDFVLQFGKRDKDEFILDIQFPLSIFQGFGLALSAFDTD